MRSRPTSVLRVRGFELAAGQGRAEQPLAEQVENAIALRPVFGRTRPHIQRWVGGGRMWRGRWGDGRHGRARTCRGVDPGGGRGLLLRQRRAAGALCDEKDDIENIDLEEENENATNKMYESICFAISLFKNAIVLLREKLRSKSPHLRARSFTIPELVAVARSKSTVSSWAGGNVRHERWSQSDWKWLLMKSLTRRPRYIGKIAFCLEVCSAALGNKAWASYCFFAGSKSSSTFSGRISKTRYMKQSKTKANPKITLRSFLLHYVSTAAQKVKHCTALETWTDDTYSIASGKQDSLTQTAWASFWGRWYGVFTATKTKPCCQFHEFLSVIRCIATGSSFVQGQKYLNHFALQVATRPAETRFGR